MPQPMSGPVTIEHPHEPASNEIRRVVSELEPRSLRTYTPSLAVLARSAGAYHWTPEGRKLADFSSGVLVANLGHNPAAWWQRVLDYLGLANRADEGEFFSAAPLTAYNAATPLEAQACRRLIDNLRSHPGGERMEQVLWAASGSEAIQKALWAALRKDPDRPMIFATRRGFHGKKGLAGAVTGSEEDHDRDPRVRFIGFPTTACGDLELRGSTLNLEEYQRELERFTSELDDRVACLITEPYLGGGGSYHPQPEYLQLLERFCREHDIVFILDEIQSNFGRTGPMYAFSHYGIQPDIVCLGKGLGNGVPVSAAVGRADILGTLDYGEASDTWSANPLASAAVLATLDEFETTDVLERGRKLSQVLAEGLLRLKQTGIVDQVRGEGCVWGVQCAAIGKHTPEAVANQCVEACYLGDASGHAIHLLGPLAGRVLRVSPPLVMDPGEARAYLDVMYAIFEATRTALEHD